MISNLIRTVLQLYFYAIFGWIVLSWIQVPSSHPLARVRSFLDRIIYPVILPIRRFVPPVRIGGWALDLSPIILLVGISLLIRVI